MAGGDFTPEMEESFKRKYYKDNISKTTKKAQMLAASPLLENNKQLDNLLLKHLQYNLVALTLEILIQDRTIKYKEG